MPPILEFGKEYGWFVALTVWLIYEGVTRIWPQWFNARKEQDKAEQDRYARLEDRVFELQAKTIEVVNSNTLAIQALTNEFNAHLGAMTRALDANTRVLAMLVEPSAGTRDKKRQAD